MKELLLLAVFRMVVLPVQFQDREFSATRQELEAQTAAAHLGYLDKCLRGLDDVRIGYIGSIKRMRIDATPKVGETLTTRMAVQEDFMNMKLVNAESFVNDLRIASAELTIAISEERVTV